MSPSAPRNDRRAVLVVSADRELNRTVTTAFQGSEDLSPVVLETPLQACEPDFRDQPPAALVLDVGNASREALEAMRRVLRRAGAGVPAVVVADALDGAAARLFLQLRLADLLVKPVAAADLSRAVRRAVAADGDDGEVVDARILAFLPATGGAGNTALAVQTAMMLHAEQSGTGRRRSTCIVDLNLQTGSCAEYLDLEPRFDIAEIEAAPDRLDRQLLEVMLSRHASGLAVVSAPPNPSEMRSFRADLVTRLLDLVATYFDTVVIDMPRTWFPWTDSVLRGADRLFVVTETTVPALRHTQRLVRAVEERIGADGRLGVIVNRVDPRGGAGTVRERDIIEVLGKSYAGKVANNYRAMREAIDRGVPLRDVAPGCDVLTDLRRIVIGEAERRPASRLAGWLPKLPLIGRRPAAARG